ncbi:MAG: hypothetical protein LC781_19770 [Actinobacteria bacterium]|nr:hypothetical protein [Actinomycetota bacterium]
MRGQSEAEVAKNAKFNSVEDMYFRLKRWGLPGLLPQEESEEASKADGKRKAQGAEGERQELPPFANAATHLRDTIHTLEDPYLEHMISLKEILQGRYFIGEGETGEANMREVRGMQWHPHPYEVVLIAVSILERQGNWGHVERLLKELHPRPAEANRQQLVRFIYGRMVNARGRPLLNKQDKPIDRGDGLLDRAAQVAALIRGKAEIGRGAKGPAIPSHEQFLVLHMRSLVEKGLSREEVAKREREEFERWKLETKQSVLEELELAKQGLDENEFASEWRDAHDYLQELEEETFDEDEFNRMWRLSKDLE